MYHEDVEEFQGNLILEIFFGDILEMLLGYIGIYWDILGYIGIYWDILGYIDAQKSLTYIITYQH